MNHMDDILHEEIAILRAELRRSESEVAQLRLKLANATCDALVDAHARGDRLQDRVDHLEKVLCNIIVVAEQEME